MKALLALLATSLALPVPTRAAAPASDPDLARGKELLRAGEYEAAVRVLEPVVRRLVRSRQGPVAADAHLHLGIGYAGLGRVEPARSEFREALRRDPAITLDPNDAPPAAVEIFSEVWREGAAKGTVAVPTPPPPSTKAAKMSRGLKIGIAAAAMAIGAAAVVTAAGADSTSPTEPNPATGPSHPERLNH